MVKEAGHLELTVPYRAAENVRVTWFILVIHNL